MDDLYELVFGVCAAWLTIEVLTKLFPEDSGELVRGVAVLTVFTVLLLGILRIDFAFDFHFQDNAYETHDAQPLVLEHGTALLQERLHALLAAAGIETQRDAKGIEVRYRAFDSGEIEIDRVCVTLRYAADRDRAHAVLESVLTKAIPLEINTG